jgi:hypothetical protein
MSYVNNPVKYISNIVKEYKQWNNAVGRKDEAAQAGQFWGAALQGRRYDAKGKQIKKK